MTDKLTELARHSVIVADSGEIDTLRTLGVQDCTTNPSLILRAAGKAEIDGPTSLSFSDDVLARFGAYGWVTTRVDGHDQAAVAAAIEQALTAGRT